MSPGEYVVHKFYCRGSYMHSSGARICVCARTYLWMGCVGGGSRAGAKFVVTFIFWLVFKVTSYHDASPRRRFHFLPVGLCAKPQGAVPRSSSSH